jgi:hypothetical protein
MKCFECSAMSRLLFDAEGHLTVIKEEGKLYFAFNGAPKHTIC